MTVSELIDELKKMPQYHPVFCDVGARYDESIHSVTTGNHDSRIGPWVVISTISDPRNDPETEDAIDLYGPE